MYSAELHGIVQALLIVNAYRSAVAKSGTGTVVISTNKKPGVSSRYRGPQLMPRYIGDSPYRPTQKLRYNDRITLKYLLT